MPSLSFYDILVAGIIATIFLMLPLFFNQSSSQLFKMGSKLPWLLGSASIFVIYWNPTLDMVNTRLVVENGYSGLWFLKDILLTIGIGPVLFVPLWAKLNITTDNQIIPLRFSGKSAKILQNFRAIYVGIIVSSIACSFYVLGILKIITAYFSISNTVFFIGFAALSVLLIIKNQLNIKIKTDSFVAILYILIIPFALFFLIKSLGGWQVMKAELIMEHADKISLSPPAKGTGESWLNILAFMSIQWWSARVLDQSNINTQRYFAIKDSWKAFKSIFVPVIIISVTFAFSSFIWDAALIKNVKMDNAEASYIYLLTESLPNGVKGALIMTFILGFITSYEAFMSWGASMITIDILEKEQKNNKMLGYIAMVLVAALSLILAIYSSQIYFLIKFILSISIGVGPVYILRWFWWRINAWSQISAMIASLVLAVGADLYFHYSKPFYIHELLQQFDISWYVLKLIVITPLVTLIWLTVTYLTPHDDIDHLRNFVKQSKTAGFWPFQTSEFHWRSKFLSIILFALAGLLPIWIVWILKLQSYLTGFLLTILWVFTLFAIYKIMRKLLL